MKHHLNGLIRNPVYFRASDTIAYIQDYRRDHRLSFNGFPILDEKGHLVGIITSSDMRFTENVNQHASEIMTTQVVTAPPGATLEEAYRLMMKNKFGKLPLVDAQGKLVGLLRRY